VDKIEEEVGPEHGWYDRTSINSGQSGLPSEGGDGDRLRMTTAVP
jgi:hypothetical protein